MVLYKPHFHHAAQSATRFDIPRKNEGQITTQRECVCHCRTETDTWSLPAGNNGTTWIIVETLHCKRKRLLLMEEAKKVIRERVIETEVKQRWMDGQSLDGELQCCVKICYPVDMRFPLPPGLEAFLKDRILSNRSVCNKTFLLIHTTGSLFCLLIALRSGFLYPIGILTVVF